MATEGYADFEGAQTWFRVYGDLPASPAPDRPAAGGPAPLVVLHGGPGATHDYLTPIAELSDTGRAVVLYDQLGNGNSTHFPERGTRRDDLGSGLRTVGFERRATIVFRVEKDAVDIVRILYGGRDLEMALRDT